MVGYHEFFIQLTFFLSLVYFYISLDISLKGGEVFKIMKARAVLQTWVRVWVRAPGSEGSVSLEEEVLGPSRDEVAFSCHACVDSSDKLSSSFL